MRQKQQLKKHLFTLGIACMLGLTACGSNNSNATTSNEPAVSQDVFGQISDEQTVSMYYKFDDSNDQNLAAMFFLGGGNQEMNTNLSSFLQKYELEQDIFEVVAEQDNCEWYAIIPKYIGTKITVEHVEMTDDGELVPTNKITTTEKPILLCCNISDIISSSKVTIQYGEEQIEFNPHLSLEDGEVAEVERIFIIK